MTLAESLANYLAVRGVDLDPGCPTTQQDVQAQSTYVLAEADELQDAVATWLAAGGRPDGDMNLQAVRLRSSRPRRVRPTLHPQWLLIRTRPGG